MLQFFIIVAALLPLTLVALHAVGGVNGLITRVKRFKGLGVGTSLGQQYNTAIPHLIGNYLPEGMLGLAVTGMLAAFMAGVAANVTAFNTVVTYDLIQAYFAKDRDSAFYLRAGRLVTIAGILVSVATAFIAKGYSNIMNYIQTLFSIFNARCSPPSSLRWSGAGRQPGVASSALWPAPSRPTRSTASPPTTSSTDRPFGVPGTPGDEEPQPSTGASDEEEIAAAKAANRFDIRPLIGGLMIFWALSKPTVPEPPETRGEGSGRIRRAPAT